MHGKNRLVALSRALPWRTARLYSTMQGERVLTRPLVEKE